MAIFKIGHSYLSPYSCIRVVVENVHQKHTICYDNIGLCAQNIGTVICLIINTIGRAYVITCQRKRKILHLPSIICALTLELELHFALCRCDLHWLTG